MDLQKLETPSSNKQQQQNERAELELKAYTFRNISPVLHKAWKTCAAIVGISMEEFALLAIQERIESVTKSRTSGTTQPSS